MKNVELFILAFCLLMVTCGTDNNVNEPTDVHGVEDDKLTITDEELLNLTQQETFKYFWDFSESNSGAARERYHPNDPSNDENTVATGGTGFGLMGILVGIERNFISRAQGAERLNQILTFFENADRFHGAWPHWINGANGTVKPFSSQDNGGDLVETAFLAQGLICIKEYFKNGTDSEKVLAAKADGLWKGIEWDWYTQGEDVLYWHWSPNHNFNMDFKLKGYNEVLITYIMAAASPDHGISKDVYTKGWADNGNLTSSNTAYNYPLLVKHNGAQNLGGPLFWAHYSYLGLNPNGLTDDYVDYWNVNVNHSLINYNYCVDNPKGYRDYGNDCWGLTASYSRNSEGDIGYSGHSPENDLGVISPTAAISSIPYTPTESLRALHYFYKNKDKLLGPAGFYDAFSPAHNYWVAEAYLAIDQGPIIIMIENYRTGLLWDLFMENEDVRLGLDRLDFTYTQ